MKQVEGFADAAGNQITSVALVRSQLAIFGVTASEQTRTKAFNMSQLLFVGTTDEVSGTTCERRDHLPFGICPVEWSIYGYNAHDYRAAKTRSRWAMKEHAFRHSR